MGQQEGRGELCVKRTHYKVREKAKGGERGMKSIVGAD